MIEKIKAAIHTGYTPNIETGVRNLSTGVPHREAQFRAYSQKCTQPGLDYFDKKSERCPCCVQGRQAVFPTYNEEMQPRAVDIDSFYHSLLESARDSFWPQRRTSYLPFKVLDIGSPVTDIEWWKMNSESLPK